MAAEAEWSAFQREIAVKYPVTEGQVFALERVQATLGRRCALVGWLDVEWRKGEWDSWGYVIRGSGPVAWARVGRVAGPEGTPYERTRSYWKELSSVPLPFVSEAPQAESDLWRERIQPSLRVLDGVEELIVIPSGAMLGVPVEALVDRDGVRVGDRYAVSYVPSATIHTWLTEGGKSGSIAGGGTLLVGDPPFSPKHLRAMEEEEREWGETVEAALVEAAASGSAAGLAPDLAVLRSAVAGNKIALARLPRLHGSRREVQAVASVCPEPTVLVGPDASEEAMVRLAESGELGAFRVIHLATHALVDDERPERSALVLSQENLPDALEAVLAGGRIYDGRLTASEVVRGWKLKAELVTLSACETGLGKVVGGEGYVGLAHAFLQAGARSLLVSLWKVDDEATALLMTRFYENWHGAYKGDRAGRSGEPMGKAEALQEAKQWLRCYADRAGGRPFEHPYYWSAFILIGARE